MTEETKNTLTQADALVTVEGILSEKKLEATTDSEGKEIIKGTLTLKVSETNFIPLNVYVNRVTNSGAENKAYAGMMTVLNEYQSIADVGEENATRVRCSKGQLQLSTYVDKRTGDVKTGVRYSASFVSRVDEHAKHPFDPKANFEVEGYIAAIADEVKDGEETGRLKVKILVPTFSGIEPMELFVKEDLASAFRDIFEIGQTSRFFGDLTNNVIENKKVIQMALGKSVTKSSYDYVDERVLTGAVDPYEEEKA